MLFLGMIFQFNTQEGSGLIMLSNGETKTFTSSEWVDASNIPSVGLEVLYDTRDNTTKIKVPSLAEKEEVRSDKKPKKDDEIVSFDSMEAFQAHFLSQGFDLLKNRDDQTDQECTMGKLADDSVETVFISLKDAPSELTKETTQLSTVDDYIGYFQNAGYRLINDFDDNGSRMLTLRRYVMDEHSEIKMKYSDAKVHITKSVNGKIVD